ncbi:MAG: bifunctional metallophosphatase/5'-nucleotidase [Clostridia bacterium]|nr:bifunctional metallophosphatase/5'-nucleotidase [Clostridia bacterium]
MKKKIVSLLLALALVFAFMPTSVFAGNCSVLQPYAGKVVVLHSNDVHGNVDGYKYMAGLAKKYEKLGAEVILADAGDFSQGTTYVSTTKGADAVDMMNAVGYDVATLGNHEFDFGYDQLKENLSKANFKVVCTDVFDADGNTIYDSYTIIEKDGLKIGFFGVETPEAQTKVNPALIKGLQFATGKAVKESAMKAVRALRARDCDVIIALSHLGVDGESAPYRSVDVFPGLFAQGLDLVIDGHSHTVMTESEAGDLIQSTGTAFENIGVVVIDKAKKEIVKHELYQVGEKSPVDKKVEKAAKKIMDRVDAEYGEVFAKSEVTLNGDKAPQGNRDSETNNGDLITDAMLWSVAYTGGITEVDADHVVAVTNGGGIRATINPGDVSKKDINTVLPFGNTVAVVYVTGAELLEALEASTYCTPEAVGGFPQVSGLQFTLDTLKAYVANDETYPGSTYYGPKKIARVTIDSVNGQPFNKDDVYAVVTNNFCAAGGDTYYAFAAATSQFDTGIPVDEAVMLFVTEQLGGVIGQDYAAPQGRIVIK